MNGPLWPHPGSRWWRFDFHTHTPASADYGKGSHESQLKQRTPGNWLLDYMRQEIDCVAVTDHNSGAWVDRLKEALESLSLEKPDGYRPLYLFPGVEISVHGGIHLLAILDPSKTTSDVDSLLGDAGFRGTKGRSDEVTTESFTGVVDAVKQAGGIVIPAHVDGSSGLFTLAGTTLAQALDCDDVFAIEVVDTAAQKPSPYSERKLRWPEVLGSDAHHIEGTADQRFPGSHYTWVKMGTPSLEGLRLALLDGPLSIRRSDQEIEDPNRHADLVIESIEVAQARYMGRSQTFKLELNPWLNVVIGGRGTGKSTMFEFLRTALRRDAELPETLAQDFEKYRKVYQNRQDDGLLTEDSRFVVTCRKDRTRFRIQWSQRGDVEAIEVQHGDGIWRPDQGDVAQRFPVRIYSQKQIFELAKAPLALLLIMDEAPEIGRRSWDESWSREEAQYLSIRAKEREIEAGFADEPRLRGELEDIKRKLAIFEEAGHAAVLKEYQRRLRQQGGLESWEGAWSRSGDRLRELARSLVPDPLDDSLFGADEEADRDISEKAANALKSVKSVALKLEDVARETDEVLTQWRQDRDGSVWKQVANLATQEYEALRDRLKNAEAGDPSAYAGLAQRRQSLEGRLKDLESRRKQLDTVRSEAVESLSRLSELRRELTTRRSTFLSRILTGNHFVRIEVIPYGAHETVEAGLRRLLQREDGVFEKDIDSLLEAACSTTPDASAVEQNLANLRRRLREISAGKYSAPLADRRFAAHVAKLPPEVFDRLDLWFPEDSLQVEYSTKADGSGFRSIQEGSPGQKTAALLAFLFSYGEEPIILDQPEDDLDNHLIYDLIVGQLRRIKHKRQLIVVTHNANIVVNGDAELVVSLVARGGETHAECTGCLQEKLVRETICLVMEGGREAFARRWKRLGSGT